MTRHIALVEDEDTIRENYADYLEQVGYRVSSYASRAQALAGMSGDFPDLLLLDVELGMERDAGFAVIQEVRRRRAELPVIFISSHVELADRLTAWRLDADDFLVKPVAFDLLRSRIECLFRRRDTLMGNRGPVNPTDCRELSALELLLDDRLSAAKWKDRHVPMTLTRYAMLRALYRAAGRTVSTEELMRAANIQVADNTVVAHIKAIRDAFKQVDPEFDRIVSERGRGYRWLLASQAVSRRAMAARL